MREGLITEFKPIKLAKPKSSFKDISGLTTEEAMREGLITEFKPAKPKMSFSETQKTELEGIKLLTTKPNTSWLHKIIKFLRENNERQYRR